MRLDQRKEHCMRDSVKTSKSQTLGLGSENMLRPTEMWNNGSETIKRNLRTSSWAILLRLY